MNLSTSISVVTVIDNKSSIVYQKVYVNNYDAASVDYDRQGELHDYDLAHGWTIHLREF